MQLWLLLSCQTHFQYVVMEMTLKLSFCLTLCSHMRTCRCSFFFLTKTTGECHSEFDGCMMSLSNISWICLSISLKTLREMFYRMGVWLVWIHVEFQYGVCVTQFCPILSNLLQNYLDVDLKILTVLVFEMYLNQLDQDWT